MARRKTAPREKRDDRKKDRVTPRRRPGGPSQPKARLLNPKFKFGANGKVESITGTCSEPGCKHTRTIKPQDAFQVRRCVECQKKALYVRLVDRRKRRKSGRTAEAK